MVTLNLIYILYSLCHCWKQPLQSFICFLTAYPFSVVVLGNFRRFFFSLFSFLLPSLDFSFIYNKFLMPFRGFFYWKNFFDML